MTTSTKLSFGFKYRFMVDRRTTASVILVVLGPRKTKMSNADPYHNVHNSKLSPKTPYRV